MRLSVLLRAKPIAPFAQSGKTFEQLFKQPQKPRKAWDGQDKDAFFRDKYAHVHAKQLKRRAEEQSRRKKVVTSKPAANPDFASKLRELKLKRDDLEFVFGTNAVRAVLQSRKVKCVYTSLNTMEEVDSEIAGLADESKVKIKLRTPLQHLEIMSANGVHNKYVAETEKLVLPIAQSLTIEPNNLLSVQGTEELKLPVRINDREFKQPLGLYIDQVTDTHNMGALLRSALWFGVDFVAFSSRNCAPLNAAVVKSSSGASEFVPLLETPYPLRFFDSLKSQNWQILATAPDANQLKKHNLELTDTPFNDLKSQLSGGPTLLVVGNEGDGIRTSLLMRSTHKTEITTHQREIDSLNVSVATAVLLSALCR